MIPYYSVPIIAEHFFCVWIFVVIHELSHVLVAKFFGLQIEKIIFSLIGAKAVIKNFNLTIAWKKFWILIAGPFANLFLAIIFFSQNNFFVGANFSLFIFNLLPIYPLDGGRILILILKKFSAGKKFFLKLNRFMIAILFLFGILQFILFFPNLSLLAIAIYLWRVNKLSAVNLIYELYFT